MTSEIVSKEIWPNFLIVGTAKAGTTSLSRYLEATPGVFMSQRGSNYFSSDSFVHNSRLPVVRDKKKYLELFGGVKDEIAIGEVCTSYLYAPGAHKRIKHDIPGARIIMILRDPIQRAYSHYLMNLAVGTQKLPFYEALKKDYYSRDKPFGIAFLYVEQGLYTNQIKCYFDAFGRENVKVLIFEEFIKDIQNKIKEVLRFIEVDANPPENINKAYNTFFIPKSTIARSIVRNNLISRLSQILPETPLKKSLRDRIRGESIEKPPMSEDAKVFLENIFREDVENLSSLLERTLPWDIASK
jgi:hypothetical protein